MGRVQTLFGTLLMQLPPDDQTVEAFHSLFHMDEFVGYEICEKVTNIEL